MTINPTNPTCGFCCGCRCCCCPCCCCHCCCCVVVPSPPPPAAVAAAAAAASTTNTTHTLRPDNCNCNYLFSGSASYRVTGPCCNCMLCVAMGQWRQAQHANCGDWMVESQMFLMDATQLFASCTPPQHSEPHPKKLKLRCYLSRCPRRTAHSTVFTRWGQASTAL